ncbi:MAG TPA: DUF6655 family protein [Verrucomicrobiae bacterium]|nr:DUF6655 family protein [Verrucomicrobiae bacterium]
MAIIIGGCSTEEITSPSRSATEQLLLSSAADRALANANLTIFAGRSVFFDFTYFDSYDSKYVEGEIRDAFSRAGALMAANNKSADVVVEARSGAFSINTNSSFFGIPSIPLPVPGTAEEPVTPQLAFYQKMTDVSYAKFALLAFDNKSRAHIYSSGPLDGKAYNNYTAILFVSWWATDIPEKAKAKAKHKYEVWYPQYDMRNLPPPTTGK